MQTSCTKHYKLKIVYQYPKMQFTNYDTLSSSHIQVENAMTDSTTTFPKNMAEEKCNYRKNKTIFTHNLKNT